MLHRILTPMVVATLALVAVVAAGTLYVQPAKAENWTGCYVGGAGGYSAALMDTSISAGGGGIGVDSRGMQGGSVAALLGCDMQVAPRVVMGVFADWTYDPDTTFSITATGIPTLLQMSLENRWGVGGRAGYLVQPGSLVYVLAGYTQAQTSNITSPAGGPGFVIGVPDLKGYVIGAGSEFALGNGLYLQAQYSYANYAKENIALGGGPLVLGLDTDVQTARVGLLFKFNTGDAANAFSPAPLK